MLKGFIIEERKLGSLISKGVIYDEKLKGSSIIKKASALSIEGSIHGEKRLKGGIVHQELLKGQRPARSLGGDKIRIEFLNGKTQPLNLVINYTTPSNVFKFFAKRNRKGFIPGQSLNEYNAIKIDDLALFKYIGDIDENFTIEGLNASSVNTVYGYRLIGKKGFILKPRIKKGVRSMKIKTKKISRDTSDIIRISLKDNVRRYKNTVLKPRMRLTL